MMGSWERFLDSLATPGGAIFLLLVAVGVFSGTELHILHHGTQFSQTMSATFTNLLSGFAGALLGALTTRSKPPGNGSSSPTPKTP